MGNYACFSCYEMREAKTSLGKQAKIKHPFDLYSIEDIANLINRIESNGDEISTLEIKMVLNDSEWQSYFEKYSSFSNVLKKLPKVKVTDDDIFIKKKYILILALLLNVNEGYEK